MTNLVENPPEEVIDCRTDAILTFLRYIYIYIYIYIHSTEPYFTESVMPISVSRRAVCVRPLSKVPDWSGVCLVSMTMLCKASK